MAQSAMVIFDFDGVIADSWWLAHKTSIKEYPDLTAEQYKVGFEGNIYDMQMSLTHLDKKKIDYFEEYKKEMHLVEFFEIEEVIRELSSRYRLAIASSSTTEVIRFYLAREKLEDCFSDILGADVHKYKHTKIEMLLSKYALKPADCVMITDTTGDIKEARAVGVDSIGVSWGFHDVERLEKENPFRIVSKPNQLPEIIDSYFSR